MALVWANWGPIRAGADAHIQGIITAMLAGHPGVPPSSARVFWKDLDAIVGGLGGVGVAGIELWSATVLKWVGAFPAAPPQALLDATQHCLNLFAAGPPLPPTPGRPAPRPGADIALDQLMKYERAHVPAPGSQTVMVVKWAVEPRVGRVAGPGGTLEGLVADYTPLDEPGVNAASMHCALEICAGRCRGANGYDVHRGAIEPFLRVLATGGPAFRAYAFAHSPLGRHLADLGKLLVASVVLRDAAGQARVAENWLIVPAAAGGGWHLGEFWRCPECDNIVDLASERCGLAGCPGRRWVWRCSCLGKPYHSAAEELCLCCKEVRRDGNRILHLWDTAVHSSPELPRGGPLGVFTRAQLDGLRSRVRRHGPAYWPTLVRTCNLIDVERDLRHLVAQVSVIDRELERLLYPCTLLKAPSGVEDPVVACLLGMLGRGVPQRVLAALRAINIEAGDEARELLAVTQGR